MVICVFSLDRVKKIDSNKDAHSQKQGRVNLLTEKGTI